MWRMTKGGRLFNDPFVEIKAITHFFARSILIIFDYYETKVRTQIEYAGKYVLFILAVVHFWTIDI